MFKGPKVIEYSLMNPEKLVTIIDFDHKAASSGEKKMVCLLVTSLGFKVAIGMQNLYGRLLEEYIYTAVLIDIIGNLNHGVFNHAAQHFGGAQPCLIFLGPVPALCQTLDRHGRNS